MPLAANGAGLGGPPLAGETARIPDRLALEVANAWQQGGAFCRSPSRYHHHRRALRSTGLGRGLRGDENPSLQGALATARGGPGPGGQPLIPCYRHGIATHAMSKKVLRDRIVVNLRRPTSGGLNQQRVVHAPVVLATRATTAGPPRRVTRGHPRGHLVFLACSSSPVRCHISCLAGTPKPVVQPAALTSQPFR